MDKELKELLKYCKNNGIIVSFVDSRTLHDYAAQNPDAAAKMGFPKIRENEIEIDKTMPEEQQMQNLKHELTEWRLMETGIDYWPAHLIALKAEKQPFDYNRPMFVEPEPEQKGNFFTRHILPHKSAKYKGKSQRKAKRQMLKAAREYQASLKRVK